MHYILEMTMPGSSQEVGKGNNASRSHESREGFQLTVRQPEKITSLLATLSALDKISERVAEDHSGDLGAGGATGTSGDGTQGGGAISLRQQALQSLPSKEVMQKKLITHLKSEVHELERTSRRIARLSSRGSAYLLTQTYARIRKIQSLIEELVDAALEVIERLYVRLFIDHQQLV